MFCTKCGAKLPDGAKFCTKCGAQMDSASPVAAGGAPPESGKGKRGGRAGIIAVTVLAAALLCACAVLFFTMRGSRDDPAPSDTPATPTEEAAVGSSPVPTPGLEDGDGLTGDTVAAVIGGVELTVEDMNYYYSAARMNQLYFENSYQQLYSQFGMEYTPEFDGYTPDAEQIKDEATGLTWADYFKETALESAREVAALTATARAEGYVLSDAGEEQVEATMQSMRDTAGQSGFHDLDSYLSRNYGRYLGEAAYRRNLTDAILADEYFNHRQDALTYTEEELDAYAQENPAKLLCYDYRYAYIIGTPLSEEPTLEEINSAKEDAKARADALVWGVEAAAGDKEAAFNALAPDAVGEFSSYAEAENTLQTGVPGNDLTTSAYYDWLTGAGRQEGDITAIESGDGYYVILFLKSYLSGEETVDVRHILVKVEAPEDDPSTADMDESADAPTREAMDAAREQAQALLDQFNAGDGSEAAFAALAEEHSDDTFSAPDGGLYRYVEEGEMIPGFNDWIFDPARRSGDTGLVENDNQNQWGWHVMYFVGWAGPKWHELAENDLKTADMAAWTERIEAPYEAAAADGMSLVGLDK